jgi:glycerophosphoryl diester phosphodiesterase
MNNRPIVIAHRGASGYLPEHTLPAKALAYAMGADYLEQDIVASRDDELIVLHDIFLDRVTNVADQYPGRARADGRFYVRDFDLEELRALSVWERFLADGSAVYPNRFPVKSGNFRIHTFEEELQMLQDLNRSTGGDVGCYPEIKRPQWHKQEGVDMTPQFLGILANFGYSSANDAVFVQCFDADELVRIRVDLACELRLVQLIGDNSWGESPSDFDSLISTEGLAELAGTVNAIGPWINQLYRIHRGVVEATSLARNAQKLGLKVHPYTFRRDELPKGFDSFDTLIRFFVEQVKVDGLFTDFADLVRHAIDKQD